MWDGVGLKTFGRELVFQAGPGRRARYTPHGPMRNRLAAGLVAALAAMVAWELLPADVIPPPPVKADSPPGPSRSSRPPAPAPIPKGTVRPLTFTVAKGDPSLAVDLPVTVTSRCGPRFEGRTTSARRLELPDTGRCDLWLALGSPDLAWELLDDDTVELVQGGDVTVRVHDEQGAPIAHAIVTGRSDRQSTPGEHRRPRPFGCTTDDDGRCAVRWPTSPGAWLTLEAPGHARSAVQAAAAPAIDLLLRRARGLTVVVEGQGDGGAFLSKTRLVVWAGDFRFEQVLTEPSTVEVDRLPAGVDLSAGLWVGRSGLGKLTFDAGVEPLAIRLQLPRARRLEVFASFDPEPELLDGDDEPLVRANVEATCGQRHLVAPFGPKLADGRHRAVFEYAPEGGCVLGASTWDGRQTFEPARVVTPASVTLRRSPP